MRRRLASYLVVSAFACFGFGLLTGSAWAQEEGGTTMQGTQSSSGSSATTGETTGSNSASFSGGPSATGNNASSSQVGNNSSNVTQSGSAKSGDPVAGGQVTGAVAPNVTVQNQNSATNPFAQSGAATLTNTMTGSLGPSATADGTAQAAQTGSNSAALIQLATIGTGDAVAGSQVTGIVGAGEHTIQNQNAATCGDPVCALSGEATLFNASTLLLGPLAVSDDVAQASQIGDNDAVFRQSTTAETGDALFGSQVAGVVGGSATVQQQNSSEVAAGPLPAAISGDLTLANAVLVVAGPIAQSNGRAQSSQTGDNTLTISQGVQASSGDALSGSQVTGGVGDQGGFFVVQNQQASEDDSSVSGGVVALNSAVAVAGPNATVFALPAEEGEDPIPGEAQASQIGDNDVTFVAWMEIGSGDSLAGAQVTGAVGYSDVTVQNQNSADAPVAESGDMVAVNYVAVNAGPVAAVYGTAEVVLGNVVIDASAEDTPPNDGEPNLGPVIVIVEEALFGDMNAQASQTGDNSITGAVGVRIGSGDAVAGGQVTGVVSDSTDVTIQNQNSADGASATSGGTTVANFVDVHAGPLALTNASASVRLNNVVIDASAEARASADQDAVAIGGVVLITAIAGAGDQTAQAAQTGDNSVEVALGVEIGSGDAVAGGQVTGVVTGDSADITIQNQNASDFSVATTGDTTVANEIDISAGPVARNEARAEVEMNNVMVDASAVAHAAAGATATAVGGIVVITAVAGVEDQEAQASQIGDNSIAAALGVRIGSGDAVAGGQVTGAVTGNGSDVTIQNQNTDEGSLATSGATDVTNDVDVQAGPRAENLAEAFFDIENVNIDVSARATSAAAAAATAVGGIVIFDLAGAVDDQTAQASQTGDNSVDVAAAVVVSSGDAVAGGQVSGVVAGSSADVIVQEQNTADGSAAITGDTNVANDVTVTAGPVATNEAVVEADIENLIIDASAFARAAADPDPEGNTFLVDGGEGAVATAVGGIVLFGFDGAVGDQDAQASQIGDNSIAAAVGVEVSSGDAVAGGQVVGVVSGDRSEVTIQNQNSADATDATTGAVNATNDVAIAAGPVASNDAQVDIDFNNVIIDVSANAGAANDATATAIGGIVGVFAVGAAGDQTAQAAQTGDNLVDVTAAVVVSSGDAVSGSQVTGAVTGDDSDVTVQNQNASDLATATSGGVTADNTVDVVAGPRAENRADVDVDFGNVIINDAEVEVGPGDANAEAGMADFEAVNGGAEGQDAQASQIGDNVAVIDTSVSASSGDAVAGSQVTGVVAGRGSEVTIQNQNVSTDADALSGDVDATNALTVALGPAASNLGETEEDTVAQASQVGDNVLDFSQDIAVASGDAVAGSQVTGVVGATDTTVQVQGSDEGSTAASGLTSAANAAEGSLTASASGDTAHASQNGDSAVSGSQSLSTDSGDAVAGTQVSGSVAAWNASAGIDPLHVAQV